MADVFISYSSRDLPFANAIADRCHGEGLSVFLAPMSLPPGSDWSREIQEALRAAPWILFVASRAAASSAFVLQEIGAAIFGQKRMIPVVWDMSPEELPGWAARYQAVDLRHQSPQEISDHLAAVASHIRQTRDRAVLVGAGLIGGLVWLLSRSE